MKRNIIFGIFFLLAIIGLIACIIPASYESKVLVLQDIESEIYTNLKNQGAAEPVAGEEGKLKITDIEKAKSQNSMPPVLNKFGKQGWRLSSINENQLYIFDRNSRSLLQKKWEYKVLSLNDVNRQAVSHLVKIKAAKAIEGEKNKFKILDAEKAKSQNIMPVVFASLGEDGWVLTAVNKAKLYIFVRSVSIF